MGETELNGQVVAIHERLERLESRMRAIESSPGNGIPQQQLDMAIDHALRPLVKEIDRRFQQQAESTGALKAMVVRTDELLGRLLGHLEGTIEHVEGNGPTERTENEEMPGKAVT